MNQIQRRDQELPYISDEQVMEEQKRARRLTQELNTVDRSDFSRISEIVKELLGKSEGAFINPPFYLVIMYGLAAIASSVPESILEAIPS